MGPSTLRPGRRLCARTGRRDGRLAPSVQRESPEERQMNPSTASTSVGTLVGEQLERRLEELLHQDLFKPPAQFVAAARVNDASLHARGELDGNEFWAEQARELH